LLCRYDRSSTAGHDASGLRCCAHGLSRGTDVSADDASALQMIAPHGRAQSPAAALRAVGPPLILAGVRPDRRGETNIETHYTDEKERKKKRE